jgi:DNA-binding transcriptional LysR family regulator
MFYGLWRDIHCLITLAEQGSFTAAAERLSISKSTVSQQITELERAIGVPLVRRTTRSVRLTDAGQMLVAEVRAPFQQIANSFTEIRDLGQEPRGLVRMTAPVALARQHLISTLPAFSERYPEIRIDLNLHDGLASLASGGFDIALRHIDTPPEAYVAKAIARTRIILVASPGYLARHKPITEPTQLEGHRHLLYPRERGSGRWSFEHIGAGPVQTRHVSVQVYPYFVANNSEVLREMACDGAGIALLPDFSAQAGIRRGVLVEVLPQWRAVSTFGRRIYLLRPYTSKTSRAARLLWDYLIDSFPKRFTIEKPASVEDT